MKERAGIYTRVSVKHYNNKDMTIENQILIAKRYINENNMECVKIYEDRGFSGADFNRPAWKNLIADAVKKKLDAVIVKDFSRVGRNYIETGEYIEKFFPVYGIRFVAVTEGYDSFENDRDTFLMGLKNIMNDWYAKESGRKVSVVKQYQKSKGAYVGGNVPYGYRIKVKDGFRMLEEHDETMKIIMQIKKLRNEGYTSYEAAAWLNKNMINRPSEFQRTNEVYCCNSDKFKKWDAGSVRRIWR